MSMLLGTGYAVPNFGDCVSHILYGTLSGKKINRTHLLDDHETIHYVTIGSVLRLTNPKHIIMGSGFISESDCLGKGDYAEPVAWKVYRRPFRILSVRGPRTWLKLYQMGITTPKIFGDPIILFPLIYNREVDMINQIGFIPHYADANSSAFTQMYRRLESKYTSKNINILCGNSYKEFIDEVNRSEYIISSSLHGVIVGLVYGKKTIFVNYSDKVIGSNFKFYDFFESVGITYEIPEATDPDILDKYIRFDKKRFGLIGHDIINVCPFIEPGRKAELCAKWDTHCEKKLK